MVSGNQVCLVFFYLETDRKAERNGRQKLGFSAVLAPAGENTLQGTYEKGLAKATPSGNTMSMTRRLPGSVGMNPERPWSDYMPSVPADKAFLFVYRILSRQDNGWLSKPGFFVDERKVADAASGSYLIAKVTPGPHRVRSTEKNTEVTVDAQPGEKYYVRVELAGGLPAKFRVRAASAEEGEAEVRTLLPLDSSRIIELKMVLVPGFERTEGDSSVSQHQ